MASQLSAHRSTDVIMSHALGLAPAMVSGAQKVVDQHFVLNIHYLSGMVTLSNTKK